MRSLGHKCFSGAVLSGLTRFSVPIGASGAWLFKVRQAAGACHAAQHRLIYVPLPLNQSKIQREVFVLQNQGRREPHRQGRLAYATQRNGSKLWALTTPKPMVISMTLASLLVAGAPRLASASPATVTIYPSTDIYRKGDFHLDSDIVTGKFRNTTFASAGLNYGLGPDTDKPFGRNDIGVEYLPAPLSGVSAGNRIVFNAKTQLYSQVAKPGNMGLRLVLGLRGVGRRGDPLAGNSTAPKDVAYLVASREFAFGRVHIGVARSFATRAFLLTPAGNAARTYLELGYEKQLGPHFRFAADYYSGKSSISAFAPSLIWYVDNKASFQLGYIRYNDGSVSPRDQIYGGFNYDFGADPYNSPRSAVGDDRVATAAPVGAVGVPSATPLPADPPPSPTAGTNPQPGNSAGTAPPP